ncbi:hypothetical protein K0U83_08090 [bacterium]|nr:hypothetical protein [bacterium]
MSESMFGASRAGAAHPNPMYDFLTGFVPRKLKDLFRWAEYLFAASPAIFAALQKLAAYAVTRVDVTTANDAQKTMWEDFLRKEIGIRALAIATGLDVKIYGNSLISVYKPFDRFLVCGHLECKAQTGITQVRYTFQLKSLKCKYECASCHKPTVGTFHDIQVKNKKRISIIRWDPKLIDIDYNPITGTSRYYYTIPADLKTKVTKGNPHIINTMPIEFLRTIQQDKIFEFAPGQIYHQKTPSPAGIDAQWGMPPLLCTIKMFYYSAVLRKANEAIALDHIVPFRVLHPAPATGAADPVKSLGLGNWQAMMTENIKQWRRDPLHIMMSPTALGVSMMGGQGRSLLTLGEVKEADDAIIAGLGIPREFVYGGLTLAGSGISLRVLENQLETDSEQQNEQLVWIIDQCASILGWAPVSAKFVPFKLIDDTEQKAALMQLQQILGNPMSKDTMLSSYDIDVKKEREKGIQEQIDDMRAQIKLQREQQKLQNSASMQADQATQQGQGMQYNPQAVIAHADELVAQLSGADQGTRQSQMDQLSQEDPVMYAVVKDRMSAQAQTFRQQAVAEAKQQQEGGVQ